MHVIYPNIYLSISSYGIHTQMSITSLVPATCVKSKGVKKQLTAVMDYVHSVSVLYSEKGK